MQRDEIIRFLDDLLDVRSIADYGPQGLQVEGRDEVQKIAVGVSASVELFRRASAAGADLIICHHGLLWDGKAPVVRGGTRARLKLLLEADITLLGYHLALDAHAEHGNNARIAAELGLVDTEPFGEYKGTKIGRMGRFEPALNRKQLNAKIRAIFGGEPLIFPFGPNPVRTIGVISGGATSDFSQAIDAGLDAYLTGEVSEYIQERAREERVSYISAGHYRTETFGVRALADLLKREFALDSFFIDVPNPV